MQNSTHISNDFKAKNVLDFLVRISPLLIIATMVIFLTVVAVIQFNFYNSKFSSPLPEAGPYLAVFGASGFAIARLAFGLIGARDISNGKLMTGILGLVATLAIAIFEHTEVQSIVSFWAIPELSTLVKFFIWIAVIAEIRLLMTVHNDGGKFAEMFGATKTKKQEPNKKSAKALDNAPQLELDPLAERSFVQNGNGHY